MIFVTSANHTYGKPWIFPTLSQLTQCRVVCLLQSGDNRTLPPNAERVLFMGDRFYQDGRFLAAIPNVCDDEVVVLADADAVIQRDLSAEEYQELNGVGDAIAVGQNSSPYQTAADEYLSLNPRCSLDGVARCLRVSPHQFRSTPMFNWGLAAATAKTWRRLCKLYADKIGDWGPRLFDNPVYMQTMLCLLMHVHKITTQYMGFAIHSHGHYPPLTHEHSISHRRLLYRGQPIFYAHFVKGVTH